MIKKLSSVVSTDSTLIASKHGWKNHLNVQSATKMLERTFEINKINGKNKINLDKKNFKHDYIKIMADFTKLIFS